jgi:glycosyltransferase involved in cell wall biosynthesis
LTRLAIAAPASPRCGVYDYAHQLADALPPDLEVLWVDLPEGRDRAAWRAAAAVASVAQVVHAHFEYGLFHTVKPLRNRFATFASRVRVPLLVTLHDALPDLRPRRGTVARYRLQDALRDVAYGPFFPGWSRRQYRRAAHWIVHTRRLRDRVASQVGPEVVTHLLHPLPSARREWCLAEAVPGTIVTPGFTKSHKGYDQLVPNLEGTAVRRWILAGGPQDSRDAAYLEGLKASIRASGLADQVEVTGYLPRPDMEECLLRACLAVLPYRWAEGSGALSWAIALGLPVAAADLPAFREVAEAGAGIHLLPSEEPGDWGARIGALLRDSERLSQLGRLNRSFAARCSMSAAGDTLARLIRRLAGVGTVASGRA